MLTGRRWRVGAVAAFVALALGLTVAPQALAQHVEPTTTTTTAAAPATTTTTRATTTTTRATTSTTAAATSTTTAAPTTTSPPTTTPTTIRSEEDAPILTEEQQASTTTTSAPPPQVVRSEAVQVAFTPGQPAQVVARSDVAFDPDDVPTVTISGTGNDTTTVAVEVIATVDEDGNLVIDVLVPEDTPESIVVVTIVALDSRGVERTLVYLFPVTGPSTTTTTASDALSRFAARGVEAKAWDELPVVPVANVPLVTQKIQAAIPDNSTEQALLTELAAEPDSVLTVEGDLGNLDDATLAVTVKPVETDNDMARGMAAAIAVGAAAVGLVALRRRTLTAQEVTR